MLNCGHLTNTNQFPVHSDEGGREEERAGTAVQTQADLAPWWAPPWWPLSGTAVQSACLWNAEAPEPKSSDITFYDYSKF